MNTRATIDMLDRSAVELATALKSGELSAEALTVACLARIEAREPQVRAFAYLDAEQAIAQARAADARRRDGAALGVLHGLPVSLKDIFDTADMPTENGSRAHAGRRPESDSAVAERLRNAGAILLGKTVTTEFAGFAPGDTRNPHDLQRTPGGSSSGSAAAVAAGMVPLAVGSQTAGSVIRPGSFCGVVAFKPQFGAISRHGCTMLSRALDHVGLFARGIEDIALLASALYGLDPRDPDAGTVDATELANVSLGAEGSAPRLAFAATPFWGGADDDTKTAFEALIGPDGLKLPRLELPEPFALALDWLNAICQAEMALEFDALARDHGDTLHPKTVESIERTRQVTALDYLKGLRGQALLRDLLDRELRHVDALVTPAAVGEAPLGLDATGDPVFCSTWTLVGHPAITIPLLKGANGLPIGVQLVGRRGADAELLRIADWLRRRG